MGKHSKPSKLNKVSRDIFIGATGVGLMFVGTQYANASPQWDALAECESSGVWSYPAGYPGGGNNGFQGGLQFAPSTWAAFGGLNYAPTAGQATREQQIEIAEKVLATQGHRAWPGCSDKLPGWWENGGENVQPAPAPAPVINTQVVRPTHGVLTSEYGSRWGAQHRGIDIANGIGTPVYAVANGEVISAGYADGFGQWVRIRHDSGNVTVYGHVSTINVSVGQRVNAGDEIAGMGSEGHSTGSHVHFEVWLGGTRESGAPSIDPLVWLQNNGVSLDWWADPRGDITPNVAPSAPTITNNEVITSLSDPPPYTGELAEEHFVQNGESLSVIANMYGTTWQAIYELNSNQIEDPNLIFPDQVLRML